jgi:hypothetical protein
MPCCSNEDTVSECDPAQVICGASVHVLIGDIDLSLCGMRSMYTCMHPHPPCVIHAIAL